MGSHSGQPDSGSQSSLSIRPGLVELTAIKSCGSVDAPHGHDAFLLDNAHYHEVVREYFNRLAREIAAAPPQ